MHLEIVKIQAIETCRNGGKLEDNPYLPELHPIEYPVWIKEFKKEEKMIENFLEAVKKCRGLLTRDGVRFLIRKEYIRKCEKWPDSIEECEKAVDDAMTFDVYSSKQSI